MDLRRAAGAKSRCTSPPVDGGTETILVFMVLALWPGMFATVAWVFGGLCLVTALARVLLAARTFR